MKTIIGLSGEAASGKGTISKYLQEKYGANAYRFSDFLRETLDVWNLEKSRENLAQLSFSMRQGFGEDIFSKSLKESVSKDSGKVVVVDGIRRPGDIQYLKELDGFKLVYVETSIEKRYERIVKRGENSDDIGKSLEEFKKDHELETEKGIKKLREIADVMVENNGTLEKLQGKVDELVK